MITDTSSDAPIARLARQLAVIQEITHIGIWQWNLATNEVSWSDELYRIYGLAPQSRSITLDVFASFLHEEDRERVLGEVTSAVARGGRFAYRERIIRPDGSLRVLDTVGEVEMAPDGAARSVVGTCRDITELRDREATIRLYRDIVENVEVGLSVWKIAGEASSAKLVSFNAACETATGSRWSIGQRLDAALPGLIGTPLLDAIAALAMGPSVSPPRYPLTLESQSRAFSVMAFPLPDGCVGLALEDVSAQVRARALQEAEQRVLEQIASGAPLGEVLTSLVRAIEALAPPAIASIVLLDETRTRIRHGAAPELPDEYNRAIDGSPIGPRAGSCGTAAFERRTVFVTDIDADPLWEDYRELARRFGLRACWSQPILASDGRVLGTFALYYREPREPDERHRELIARATHVAGIAIQRKEIDDQLRALSARADAVREEERTAVAREIHDQLGQALTALKMDIAWVARRTRGEPATEAIPAKLEAMSRLTDGIIDDVRRISAELRPGVLDDLGLLAAIEWQASEFEERTGTTCVVRAEVGSVDRFERNVSTAVFRIFQEALTNVARHAEATHVEVAIRCRGGSLELEVKDDGKGIPDEAISSPSSLGLLGMRERARRLGGVTALSRDGRGTSFSVVVPLEHRPVRAPQESGGLGAPNGRLGTAPRETSE